MLMTGSTMRSIFNQTAEGGGEGRAPFGRSMAWKESSTNLSSAVGELEAVNKVLIAELDRGLGARRTRSGRHRRVGALQCLGWRVNVEG